MAAAPAKKQLTVIQQLAAPAFKAQLALALPGTGITADRLARIVMTCIRKNQALGRCSSDSLLGAVMTAAQLGLEPGVNCHLVPYKTECTFIAGYQGVMDLAYRTDRIEWINAVIVREGDEFEELLGSEMRLIHTKGDVPNAPMTHVYAVARMKGSEHPVFVVLTRDECEAVQKASKAGRNGPWVTHFEAMCQKTAIIRLCKFLPKSAEMARMVAIESAQEAGLTGYENTLDGVFSVEDDDEQEPPAKQSPMEAVAAAVQKPKSDADEFAEFLRASESPKEVASVLVEASKRVSSEEMEGLKAIAEERTAALSDG